MTTRLLFVLFLLTATQAVAQPRVTASLSNLTRVESWSFFTPIPGAAMTNPKYTFVGDRARLRVQVEASRIDLTGSFTYVAIENLPRTALGPGALGTGAFYFAAVAVPYSYQLYVSDLALRAHTADSGFALAVGRMGYTSGAEAVSSDARIEALKRLRLDGRLIGEFEWSYYQRKFDGARVDVDRPAWHATASLFAPTQGGFEESANLTMPKLQLGSGTLTLRHGAGERPAETQVFAHLYRDRRAIEVRPDNQFLAAAAADVTVAAVGVSRVEVRPVGLAELDTLLWGAGEVGNWYGQPHRAFSAAAEAGVRWPRLRLSPWLRAGLSYASGDGEASDGRHNTFLPLLPDGRRYAMSATYAQMNLRDVFAQVLMEHGRVRARVDVHRLDLASAADGWYHGSGATARAGTFFGFSARPSGGRQALGTVLEGSADVRIAQYWSMNGYVGAMRGGDVVANSFTNRRLIYWYIENVIAFSLP